MLKGNIWTHIVKNHNVVILAYIYINISTYVLNTCRLTLGSYGKAWFICCACLLFPDCVVVSYIIKHNMDYSYTPGVISTARQTEKICD